SLSSSASYTTPILPWPASRRIRKRCRIRSEGWKGRSICSPAIIGVRRNPLSLASDSIRDNTFDNNSELPMQTLSTNSARSDSGRDIAALKTLMTESSVTGSLVWSRAIAAFLCFGEDASRGDLLFVFPTQARVQAGESVTPQKSVTSIQQKVPGPETDRL